MWPAVTRSYHRRQKDCVSLSDRIFLPAILQMGFAGEANEYPWRVYLAGRKWRVTADSPDAEMLAFYKLLPQDRGHLLDHRWERRDGALVEIDADERLIDLQRPMLTCLGIDVVPVVEAKRHVTVFLHFKDDHVVQRVNRARPHKDGVVRIRHKAGQTVLHRAVRERVPQVVCRGRDLQARIDAAFRSIHQDYPRLGLSRLTFWNKTSIPIVRMHLNRKPLTHIEKFQEQRKPGEAPG